MMEKLLSKLPRFANLIAIVSGTTGLTWTLWQAGLIPLLHGLAILLLLAACTGMTLASLGVAGVALCRGSVLPSERVNQVLLRACCGWLLLAGAGGRAWAVPQCGLK